MRPDYKPAFDMPTTTDEALAWLTKQGDPLCMTFSSAHAKRAAELLAAELDATPPAGAGEAVAWQLRYRIGASGNWSNWITLSTWDGWRNPDHEYRPLYAAPTPLPEAVREAIERAIRMLDPQDGLVVGEHMRRDAANALRALTGGDKQGDTP